MCGLLKGRRKADPIPGFIDIGRAALAAVAQRATGSSWRLCGKLKRAAPTNPSKKPTTTRSLAFFCALRGAASSSMGSARVALAIVGLILTDNYATRLQAACSWHAGEASSG